MSVQYPIHRAFPRSGVRPPLYIAAQHRHSPFLTFETHHVEELARLANELRTEKQPATQPPRWYFLCVMENPSPCKSRRDPETPSNAARKSRLKSSVDNQEEHGEPSVRKILANTHRRVQPRRHSA
jgi:hypothetical protein